MNQSRMYLENCIQEIYDKKNIKTSEVIVITKVKMINLSLLNCWSSIRYTNIRENELKKQPIANACNAMQV